MAIQWFPGHMHAARKQVAETMAKVDLVIEIVDARLPWSSSNPMIESLRLARQRPALKILNKQDLADPVLSKVWLDWFKSQPGVDAVLMGEDNKIESAKRLPTLCRKLVPHRSGEIKPVRAMILGIPNVGKSTLMNHLARRRVANVADTPGVTKSQQRIELQDGTILYDTPGLMWPKVHDENSGYRLAMAGSIGTNAYDQIDVAWFAIDTLRARYPQALLERYGLKEYVGETEDIFAAIAKRRGAVLSGGRIDEQKAAEMILTEFRSGQLGRITLETPDDITEPVPDEEQTAADGEAEIG